MKKEDALLDEVNELYKLCGLDPAKYLQDDDSYLQGQPNREQKLPSAFTDQKLSFSCTTSA